MDRLRGLSDGAIQHDVVPFFQRLSAFKDGSVVELRYDQFHAQFSRTRTLLGQIKEQARVEDRSVAQSYNIFDILGLPHYEVTTHSAFLGNLLSPDGSHGQGDLFFRSFVERIAPRVKRERFLAAGRDDYEVTLEKSTDDGYIDIFVQSRDPRNRFAIVIENKIFAGDQSDQLQRYYTFVTEERGYDDVEILIVYLTPSGHAPSSLSLCPDERSRLLAINCLTEISYCTDVAEWLRAVLPQVEAVTVSEVIKQYLRTIEVLGRK